MRIALYQPDIPQNSGNIFRLGACFGISIDIIEPTGYIFDDKRFRRSSMDYINHIDYKRHIDWENFINWSKKNNFRLILLTTKAEKKYCDYTYKNNDIFLQLEIWNKNFKTVQETLNNLDFIFLKKIENDYFFFKK